VQFVQGDKAGQHLCPDLIRDLQKRVPVFLITRLFHAQPQVRFQLQEARQRARQAQRVFCFRGAVFQGFLFSRDTPYDILKNKRFSAAIRTKGNIAGDESMLLTDYLASVKPIKYDNSALFLLKMEGWMRLSRTDAAQLCAMNPASVTQLSNELMEAGLIRECGRAITPSGRKPVFLELAPQAGLCVSLLMQGESSRLAIHNLHHEIIGGATLPALVSREGPRRFAGLPAIF
jgi:hypothetical protein